MDYRGILVGVIKEKLRIQTIAQIGSGFPEIRTPCGEFLES